MRINERHKEELFVSTVRDIISSLGFDYSDEDIRALCLEQNFLLHLQHKKQSHIHIGIWAVGDWGFVKNFPPNEFDLYFPGGMTDCLYGPEFKPETICIFVQHEWSLESFKPSLSHWMVKLNHREQNFEEEKKNAINHIRTILESSDIQNYYDLVDFDEICLHHKNKNKLKAYLEGMFRYSVRNFFKKRTN